MTNKITWASVEANPKCAIEFLVESNRIEGVGDEGSALRYARAFTGNMTSYRNHNLSKSEFNSMRALKFVVQHYQEALTVEKLLKLHAIQMQGTMPVPKGKKRRFKAGVFREQPVYVNREEKPAHTRIPTLINEFLDHFNDDDRGFGYSDKVALRTHYHFECIHPFMDGNGRVGRLLWLWDWLRNKGTKGSILGGVGSILDFFEDNPFNIRFPENIPVDERGDSFLSKRKSYYDAIGEYEKELGWVEEENKEKTLYERKINITAE